MYQLVLERDAKKDLKKIDKQFLRKISAVFDLLANDPFVGQKMAGEFAGSYRVKIPPLRIIYAPDLKRKMRLLAASCRGIFSSDSLLGACSSSLQSNEVFAGSRIIWVRAVGHRQGIYNRLAENSKRELGDEGELIKTLTDV